MYATLYNVGNNYATTDDHKFNCTSIAYPRQGKFMPYGETDPSFYSKEYFNQLPHQTAEPILWESNQPKKPLQIFCNEPSSGNSLKNSVCNMELFEDKKKKNVTFLSDNQKSKSKISPSPISPQDYEKELDLLPVLDCRFNMREICKQCILLEDHLSHEKKRCMDCCIKHFLALEGLSEEAITLDKAGDYKKLLQELPDKIREIQKLWFTGPDVNAHQASQKLREIRKEMMPLVFDMIFDAPAKCEGGVCKIKK